MTSITAHAAQPATEHTVVTLQAATTGPKKYHEESRLGPHDVPLGALAIVVIIGCAAVPGCVNP